MHVMGSRSTSAEAKRGRLGKYPPNTVALDNNSSVIETERLVLRLPRVDDAKALLEFVGDPEVMHPIGDEPGGPEKAEVLVDRWLKRWERNGVGQFIVERDCQLIGRVGLIVWDRRSWETSAYELAGEHAQEELGWARALKSGSKQRLALLTCGCIHTDAGVSASECRTNALR